MLVEALRRRGRAAEARLPALQPHARAIAHIAHELEPLAQVLPIYLRPPDAKPQSDPLRVK
jgi:hypothetical protein